MTLRNVVGGWSFYFRRACSTRVRWWSATVLGRIVFLGRRILGVTVRIGAFCSVLDRPWLGGKRNARVPISTKRSQASGVKTQRHQAAPTERRVARRPAAVGRGRVCVARHQC
jgi:hypothetical protein